MAAAAETEGGLKWDPGFPDTLLALVTLPTFRLLSNFVTSAFSFPIGLFSSLGVSTADLALMWVVILASRSSALFHQATKNLSCNI